MPTGIYKRSREQKEKLRNQILEIGKNTRFPEGHKSFRTKESYQKAGKKMSGEKNPMWKDGIRKSNGYVWILKPSHLKAVERYVKQAVLAMEKKIGRLLTKEEVVHHIGAKDDDRSGMLWLFNSGKEHKSYHLRIMATYRNWGMWNLWLQKNKIKK